MSKPKLPKVWVMFDGDEPSDVALRKDPEDQDVYRYAPVQKPKVCVWTEDGEFWSVGCDPWRSRQIEATKFCPNCGRKIKVTK